MYPERDAIRSYSETLFSLVADNATPKQWSDWLRPQVRSAYKWNDRDESGSPDTGTREI